MTSFLMFQFHKSKASLAFTIEIILYCEHNKDESKLKLFGIHEKLITFRSHLAEIIKLSNFMSK